MPLKTEEKVEISEPRKILGVAVGFCYNHSRGPASLLVEGGGRQVKVNNLLEWWWCGRGIEDPFVIRC